MSAKATCFVIMPFGRKPGSSGREIDFDAIWEHGIAPAVRDAGLDPIRADEDVSAGLIHKAMFERLVLSEYAVADLSIINPNVYYELGIRHAVRPQTTVLTAASDCRLPFDVAHLRTLPYETGRDGRLADPLRCRTALATKLAQCVKSDEPDSPLFMLLDGIEPPRVDHAKTDVFRRAVDYSRSFKDRLRQARERGGETARTALDAIRDDLGDPTTVEAGVVVDLLLSYRAIAAHDRMVALVATMDPVLAKTVLVREQLAFALNRLGERRKAETILMELIAERGPSSETLGILGRVYKDLWEEALKSGDITADAWGEKAIAAYLRGFETDWRDAYPGINAVSLMGRMDPNDPRIATLVPVVRYAVERRLASGAPDYWDFATMVELAANAGDDVAARRWVGKALAALREPWEAGTTARNLRVIATARRDAGLDASAIEAIADRLEARAAG
jgi:hypothetical protein